MSKKNKNIEPITLGQPIWWGFPNVEPRIDGHYKVYKNYNEIPEVSRVIGAIVGILSDPEDENSKVNDYWFQGGTSEEHLVPYSNQDGIGKIDGQDAGTSLIFEGGKWVARKLKIEDLEGISAPSEGDKVLVWNGTGWEYRDYTTGGSTQAQKLKDLKDVNIGEASDNQVLTRQGEKWVNADLPNSSVDHLMDIGDVQQILHPLYDKDILRYNETTKTWVNDFNKLRNIIDVEANSANNGDVLTYNSESHKWVSQAPQGGVSNIAHLNNIGDVNVDSASNGQVLTYENGHWIAKTLSNSGGATSLAGLSDTTISPSVPNNSVLCYTGNTWENKQLSTSDIFGKITHDGGDKVLVFNGTDWSYQDYNTVGGSGATKLEDLTDVDIDGKEPNVGEVLTFVGKKGWTNSKIDTVHYRVVDLKIGHNNDAKPNMITKSQKGDERVIAAFQAVGSISKYYFRLQVQNNALTPTVNLRGEVLYINEESVSITAQDFSNQKYEVRFHRKAESDIYMCIWNNETNQPATTGNYTVRLNFTFLP